MLRVERLSYRHIGGETYRYDLTVAAGELVGLTGRSGAGKSTLLDLIAGFLAPECGRVEIDGQDVLPLPPERRPLTILFQRHNLFEHLTAETNVALGIRPNLKLDATQTAQVHTALEEVGIGGMARRFAHTLSGGEQQRVALARTLVRDRPVLLLDEPFSALDEETRVEMLALVRRLVDARNTACLMVTHDRRDCDRIADRHLVLKQGRIEAARS